LFQSDVMIKDDDVLNLLSVTQTLKRLSGETEEPIYSNELARANGQFKQRIEGITEPGNYELVTLVDGKTFSRQLSQYFAVHPAIEFTGASEGGDLVAFTAKPVNLKLNVLRSNIKLEFSYGNGTIETQEMPLIGQGYWEKVIPVSVGDNVKLRAKLVGMTQTDLRFDYWTPSWSVSREAGRPPVVTLGDNVLADELITPSSADQEVAPVSFAPTVSVVDDNQENQDLVEEASESVVESTQIEKIRDKASSITTREWIMYGVLNLGAILIIGSGVLLYRRMRSRKSIKRDDLDDV